MALMTYQAIPDDYLESTEALLQSAFTPPSGSLRPDSNVDYTPTLARRLTTPLGLGALLLLLVSSAGLGYLLTNPSAAKHLSPAVLLGRNTPEQQAATANAGETAFAPGLAGSGPDLSEKEFVDLSLGTLSTLPTTAAAPGVASTPLTLRAPSAAPPTPATPPGAPAAPAATAPLRPANGLPPVASRPTPVPTTVRAVPAPARPAPARPAPARPAASQPAPSQPAAAPRPVAPIAPPPLPAAASPAPSASAAAASHYVVTDYTGDQSLSAARTAVEGAYVRNFPSGARIQLGAFDQAASAEELVESLQRQGISAEVYSPQ